MTLLERVRYYIGESGPQHDTKEEYENYIEDRLERMTRADLLLYISIAMDDVYDTRN